MPNGVTGGGLRNALHTAAVSLLDLIGTRLQLALLEFNEQRERAKSAVALLLVAALFFAFFVLAVSAFVVVVFWDTHRLVALGGVAIVHLVIAIIALTRLKAQQRAFGPPFAQTLAEFELDREWLAGKARDGTDSEVVQ